MTTAATTAPRSRRLAPGYYEVDTPLGTFTVDLVENAKPGNGYPPQAWHLTWPGERWADGSFATKRECLEAIAIALADAAWSAR